ncbi:MAG: antitoxin ParD1/3/4 [Phenylobacterium sp.]|jgi:antitoxin ParD1/3/4
MAMVKKSITVTNQQDLWIKSQMANGNYGTDSELIREAIREKQNRTSEIEAIRVALIEGEQSGISERTPDDIINAVIARKRAITLHPINAKTAATSNTSNNAKTTPVGQSET